MSVSLSYTHNFYLPFDRATKFGMRTLLHLHPLRELEILGVKTTQGPFTEGDPGQQIFCVCYRSNCFRSWYCTHHPSGLDLWRIEESWYFCRVQFADSNKYCFHKKV